MTWNAKSCYVYTFLHNLEWHWRPKCVTPWFPWQQPMHTCVSLHLCLNVCLFQMWVCGLSAAAGKVRFCRRQLGVSSHFRETAVPEMSRDRTQTNQLRKRSGWIDSLPFHEWGEARTHTRVVRGITMLVRTLSEHIKSPTTESDFNCPHCMFHLRASTQILNV